MDMIWDVHSWRNHQLSDRDIFRPTEMFVDYDSNRALAMWLDIRGGLLGMNEPL